MFNIGKLGDKNKAAKIGQQCQGIRTYFWTLNWVVKTATWLNLCALNHWSPNDSNN
jgi:hypothetical protein